MESQGTTEGGERILNERVGDRTTRHLGIRETSKVGTMVDWH